MNEHNVTIGGTVLKLSDDLDILEVTFDSNMTFEKHLRLVSRAAFQRLGILWKSWWVFHDRLLLGRCFRDFLLPILEYCSTVWCSAARTHLKLMNQSVVPVLKLGFCLLVILHIINLWQYYVCYIRSSVTRSSLFTMYYLCHMSLRVTRGSWVAHRYSYAPPVCGTSQ